MLKKEDGNMVFLQETKVMTSYFITKNLVLVFSIALLWIVPGEVGFWLSCGKRGEHQKFKIVEFIYSLLNINKYNQFPGLVSHQGVWLP